MKWYKRDPEAFKGGTLGLSLEEIGAYTLVLDDIYARGGSIPDDPDYLRRLWRCDRRVCARLRQRLIDVGKIQVSDELITNLRATCELSRLQVRATNGKKLRKINENEPTEYRRENIEKRRDTNIEPLEGRVVLELERHPLPKNWSPNEAGIGMSPIDLWEVGKFRDYQLSKGATSVNWEATWRLWKSKELYGKGYKEGATNQPMDLETRRKALQRLRDINGGINDEEVREEVRRDTGLG